MSQTLKPTQRKVIAALLESGHVSDAAAAAGVSRDSVHRWLRGDPVFVAALREAEADALQSLSRQLIALGTRATATVESVMLDAENPASVRLKAADTVLSRLLQLRELVDLESRVEELEQRLEGRTNARH